MKKFACLLLIIAFIFSLCACGKTDTSPTQSEQSTESQTDKNEQNTAKEDDAVLFFNTANYNSEEQEPYQNSNNVFSKQTSYTLKSEPSCNFNTNVNVDSTNIILGTTTIKEIINNGWVLESGNQRTSSVKANIITNATAKSSNGKYATFYAVNNTDNPMNFEDCIIVEVIIKFDNKAVVYDGTTEAANFTLEKEINNASAPADYISAYGEPMYIYVTDYFNGDVLTNSVISLNYGTDKHGSVNLKATFTKEGDNVKITEFCLSYTN